MSMNLRFKAFATAAAWLTAGIIGAGVAPAVFATPQEEKATPVKPVTPAFAPLDTATKGASTIQASVIQRSLDKDGKLVDKTRLQVTIGPSGVARIEQEILDTTKPERPPLLENPTLAVFDGKETIVYDADNHKYLKFPASNGVPVTTAFPIRPVWLAVRGLTEAGIPLVTAPEETIDGRKMIIQNLDITPKGSTHPSMRQRYVIDAETHLLYRMETIFWQGEMPRVTGQYEFRDWKVNPNVAATYFDFILPAEAEEAKPPKMAVTPPPPGMLQIGTTAPDFTMLGPGDKPIKLSDLKGKVVVLDFWATWCMPCLASMPHLQSVYDQVKGNKDVAVVALCVSDLRPSYDTWLSKNKDKYSFPVAYDPAGRDAAKNVAVSLYKAASIPTQYVIDKDGKVAAVLVGFGGAGDQRLEDTLIKLGIPVSEAPAKP